VQKSNLALSQTGICESLSRKIFNQHMELMAAARLRKTDTRIPMLAYLAGQMNPKPTREFPPAVPWNTYSGHPDSSHWRSAEMGREAALDSLVVPIHILVSKKRTRVSLPGFFAFVL
jgi:hypothetical protein